MNYYQVGKIVNTHGIKGEVKVQSITDFPQERFAPGAPLYVFRNDQLIKEVTVKTHRKHKNFELLSFEGLQDINLVEDLKQTELKIAEDQQGTLNEGEYYYHEIIGLKVYDLDNNYLGEIKEIMESGANDVWIIQRVGQKDLLIPAISDVIKDIQVDQGKVTIEMLDGLDD